MAVHIAIEDLSGKCDILSLGNDGYLYRMSLCDVLSFACGDNGYI